VDKELEVLVEAAEQLERLKETLKAQGDATSRMRGFAEVLEKVTEQVSRVPAGLAAVLVKAEAAEQRLAAAAAEASKLAQAVPSIVERIEGSDVGRSAAVLAGAIASSREDLKGFREATGHLEVVVEQIRVANGEAVALMTAEAGRQRDAQAKTDAAVAALRAELLARLDQLHAGLETGAKLAEASTWATASAFQQSTAAVRAAGERQAEMLQRVAGLLAKLGDQDVAGLRGDVAKLSQQLTEQAQVLKSIANKKGFSF
jgi:hypothetical protein